MRSGITGLIGRLPSAARVALSLFVLSLFCLCLLAPFSLHAQQVGTNVNMVTGTKWPGGDPFLQRQNEPSMAISSRNPLHMVAGDNDYRSVDLPAVSGEVAPTGDAWLGWFTSFDGGQTWSSILVPGYPQDTSLAGELSPIHGLGAGADPMVRVGTNGMFYYSGLAFNRQAGGASKVFVATYTDDNDLEGSNSIRYLWTTVVDTGKSNLFEDKPAIAVDIPRSWSGFCIVPALPLKDTQIFRAGTVYAAWTQFTGPETNDVAAIMFSESIDCGLTWSPPVQISGTAKTNQGATLAIDPKTGALYIAWRVFASTSPTQADAIMYVASFNGGATFTKPQLVTDITAFDQGETYESFRTNDYPTISVDDASHVYVAWSQRDVGNAAALAANGGDARIVVATGTPTSNPTSVPLAWNAPLAVDPYLGRGHQIMPGMAFTAGKLTVAWYDLRYDDELAIYTALESAGAFSEQEENDGGAPNFPSFGMYIEDPTPPYPEVAERQTLDVRAAQALPGNPPAFFPSVQVTDYAYGSIPPITPTSLIQQLQVDPPNLPMFQSGTLPFFGDYIDVAGPTFIPLENGTWRFNNLATDPDFTHVVWADNRDVVPPADGNWANYTPPTYPGSTTSTFDPTQTRPACTPSTPDTGDRNQNIYTAQLAPGLVLSSPGNAKQLGTGSNGQLIQRQFAIVVTNTTAATQYYELTIEAQPTGGAASFLQFAVAGEPFPLTQIQVAVPALSSTSRAIFVTSTVANATVTVSAAQLTALGGTIMSAGETASVTINGDPNNPASQDTNIASAENYTPTIATPNIANPNIANPNIANPNIANPNIANPNIANPNIANPNIANPNIANPNIANPNIANPNIANTDLSDGTVTDGTWAITNTGNTSSAYAVNLIGQSPPPGIALQLIVYGTYTTPLVTPASGCTLITESHFVPVANIVSPSFATLSQLFQPAATNPTLPGLALKPGETKYVTVRVYDPTTNNPAQALLDYNPITAVTPAVVSQGANTGTTTPPATLTILTKALLQATLTGTYLAQTLQATGGSGAYTWSLATGALPTGISLTNAGVISGTPTGSAGTSSFTVQVKDAVGDIAQQPLTIVVNPAPVISPSALPAATQYLPYSQTFSVTPGTGTAPFVWSAVTLPSFLTFNPSNQVLSGTPTVFGSFPVTIKVTDANGVSTSPAYSLLVNAAGPAIGTSSLPNGQYNSPYPPLTLSATSGTAPYTWSLGSGGVLPAGMALSPSGNISGTPAQAGMWSIPITVTDANSLTANTTLSLTVGLATGYAGSGNCYMPYPTTPMYYSSNGTAGPWSVTAPEALSGQMTFLPAVTVTVAGYVNTNGTSVTWTSDQGGQNDQFYLSPVPSSIVINNVTYPVASINSATTLTLAQSAGVQSFVPYSYTLPAGGNLLAGCFSGEAITSGSYQLQLTAGTSTFTLPLQVVASDTQDNGIVNVNSEGVGNLPPSGFQQGVVITGQSFAFLPGTYAADSGFSGNALFGFNGTAPQLCGTFQNVPNSLSAASQAGRYDIAIDGTTQSCTPIPAFPTSPAPIVFESVDTLPSSTFFGGATTISGLVLSSGNPNAFVAASNVLEIEGGGTSPNPVTVAFNYTINDSGCPGCIDQLQVGLNTDPSPQTYAYNGGSFSSGSASVHVNVPNTPGRYYIAIDFAEDYGFLYSSAYWANGQPTATRYIGVVDVW
ncbi:MAG: putative Ig domain-containing protein [Candidatus Sulfotelmatobacter sp.]